MRGIFLISGFLVATLSLRAQELLPTSTTGQIIHHKFYTLSYSEKHEQAEWVYYYLDSNRITFGTSRTDNFREDPAVTSGSATLADYRGSGYDRGHLSPAADNTNGFDAMSESFYMSNMSPQSTSFNRGIWSKLESQIRSFASAHGGLHVVTAGILTTKDLPTIGPNKVAVPNFYYKIAYDDKKQLMIGFILPNEGSQVDLKNFVVSVDSIEALSGIDFFPSLPDSLENALENHSDFDSWLGSTNNKTITENKSETGSAVQCKGIAKSTGVRCKNKTTNANGYCYLHQSQSGEQKVNTVPARRTVSVQCRGTTKSGARCKNKTLNASGYCYLHDK